MENPVPKKIAFLVPPLPLIEEAEEDSKSTDVIEFLLKQRAGSGATAPSYKLKVHRFQEGTVGQWIAVRKSISELWVQNSLVSQTDRLANIKAILRGESLTVFEVAIEELTHDTNDDGTIETIILTDEMLLSGLNAVAETVFPHRALEIQKQWMRRGLKKPKTLTFCKTVAAVGRLNNSIPYFPKGSESDKFTKEEIVALLEWSIPQAWRTKFDLEGYIPTSDTKERMITECEQIERNEPAPKTLLNVKPGTKPTVHKKGRDTKHKNGEHRTSEASTKFYCTEHGKNATHNTDACYTLKNRAGKPTGSTNLTKKSFRREINVLSRTRPKKKVIEMFAAILKAEHDKIVSGKNTSKSGGQTKKSARKKKVREYDSDSDESGESIHAMDESDDGQTFKVRTVEEFDRLKDEETSYQSKIANLGAILDNK